MVKMNLPEFLKRFRKEGKIITVKQYLQLLQDIDIRIDVLERYPQGQKEIIDYKKKAVEQIHKVRNSKHAALLEYRYMENFRNGRGLKFKCEK